MEQRLRLDTYNTNGTYRKLQRYRRERAPWREFAAHRRDLCGELWQFPVHTLSVPLWHSQRFVPEIRARGVINLMRENSFMVYVARCEKRYIPTFRSHNTAD